MLNLMPGPLAVTGATGAVGGRVAARLAEQGVEQRLVVRDASRSPDLAGGEVRVSGGYADARGMREAFAGAATVFLVPAAEAADRIEQHRTAVDAAVAAGVERLVYLSFVSARPDATFTLVRHHWATEEHVRASGLRWTFLRMNLYLDFVPAMAGADGVIRGPAGSGRFAGILRDDVAAAAAAVLVRDDVDGQTFDLTGREAISLAEAAAIVSRHGDREIRFEHETVEEAYASRAAYGAPDHEVEGWVTSYLALAAGDMEAVSTHVRDLTGRDPLTLEEWLENEKRAASATR